MNETTIMALFSAFTTLALLNLAYRTGKVHAIRDLKKKFEKLGCDVGGEFLKSQEKESQGFNCRSCEEEL